MNYERSLFLLKIGCLVWSDQSEFYVAQKRKKNQASGKSELPIRTTLTTVRIKSF